MLCNLHTLGGWSLRDPSAKALPQIGRKSFALLTYLALSDAGRVPRDRLADLLWPDRGTVQARNSLRQTLAVLRTHFGPGGRDLFIGDRQFIGLAPGHVLCDARSLIDRAAAGDTPHAIAELYAGPFLDGFFSGSPVFDDWARGQRDRLDAHAIQAFEQLVHTAPRSDAPRHLARLLAIDPAREASYQAGMELYAALRQRDQALRLYELCKAALLREYGVNPSPDTERLRRRILDGQPPAPAVAPPPTAPKPVVRVMRFANLSDHGQQDRFLDGLHEAIVIELSNLREVVALHDTADADAIELPAHYMLKGSLLSQGDRIEIITRLVDTQRGLTIAGEKFRGSTADGLDFLNVVSQTIALSTRFDVLHAGWNLQDVTPADPPEVRLLVLQAHSRYYELTAGSLREAVRLAEQAMALAPSSLRAQRTLSLALSGSLVQGVLPRTPETVARAIELARRVARAAPEDVFTRCVLAWALGNAGLHESAVDELRYAIRLNPRYATLHSDLAEHYALLGRTAEALAACDEAILLSSDDVVSFWRYHSIAVAQFAAGNYSAALSSARRAMREKPGLLRSALIRAASAAALGLQAEASLIMADILRDRPDLRLETVCPDTLPRYVQDHHHQALLAMLAKAGLPGATLGSPPPPYRADATLSPS